MCGNAPEICGCVQTAFKTAAGSGRSPSKKKTHLIPFVTAGRDSFVVVSAHLRPLSRSCLTPPSRYHEPRRNYHLCSTIRNSEQPPDHPGNCADTRKTRGRHVHPRSG